MTQWLNRTLWGFILLVLAACGGGSTPPTNPFTLEPSTKTLEVVPGGVSSFSVSLKRSTGFSETVNMTFEGLPDGITQRWSRDNENGDCTVQLSIDPEIPEGDYTITLKGETAAQATSQSAGVRTLAANTQTVTVSVQPTPGGSGAQGFTLSFSPTIVTVQQTNTVATIATVTPVNGFSQDVTFSVSNLPPNVGVVVDPGGPNNQFIKDKFKAFLRFTPGTNSVPGDYTVSVKAQSANFSQTQPLLVKVFPQGDTTPTFSFFSDAVSLTLRQDGVAATIFRLVRRNGFTAPITIEPQLATFPGVTANQINTIGTDGVQLLFRASPNATTTNGLFQGLLVKATGGGITRQLLILLKVEPRPGGRDNAFSGSLGGFKVDKEQALAAGSGQHFVAGKLSTDDGFIKLNNSGTPDTSFGTANGIAIRAGLSSATASFATDSVMFLPGTSFPVRAVGRLIPTNVADGDKDLGMLGFSSDGKQNFIKAIEFSAGIGVFGNQTPVRAIGIGENTIVTGTITPGGNSLPRCFLTLIQPNGEVPVKKEFRFNPLTSIDSQCASIAGIPGNTSRFYVGGNQTNVLVTPIVAKFGLDGELDKNFAGDGVAKLEGLGSINNVTALAVQSNGKILAGFEREGTLMRLNTDGKLDTTFGNSGIVKLTPPNLSGVEFRAVKKLTIGANGAIFALISNDSAGSNVAKLNSSGVLQTGFANNGFLDFSAQDILAQSGNVPVLLVLNSGGIARFFQ
jgi:uncharacterized delta-60 repeat protein